MIVSVKICINLVLTIFLFISEEDWGKGEQRNISTIGAKMCVFLSYHQNKKGTYQYALLSKQRHLHEPNIFVVVLLMSLRQRWWMQWSDREDERMTKKSR